ncbi:MAG TPA: FeoB-associated Cys-rich membrane protein [Lachnospiraceae bacterium]|nr:FeoB-associated Cys-rich membrane protein [Lachnospiraceae bacterium]
MGTIIGTIILLIVVGLIIRSMIRDKKKGKSVICGGECAHCGHTCPHKRM